MRFGTAANPTADTVMDIKIASVAVKPDTSDTSVAKTADKPKEIPSVTSDLPKAFRASRPLYPKEKAYLHEIFKDSLDYDKIRLTRDHWFSYGSTHVVGNTIHLTSSYGGNYIFEDTPEQQLNEAGLYLIGHEAMHVWQFQNGGWAYAVNSIFRQLAGYYSTGSRNTAYNWQMAVNWEVPWEQWGQEQQAQLIDQWNQATRNRRTDEEWQEANPPSPSGDFIIKAATPYLAKVRNREGAASQYSIPGTLIGSLLLGGAGYLWKGKFGANVGIAVAILLFLPWNRWAQKKQGDKNLSYAWH